jgi:DNA-binding SARP family transcriptional activator
MSDMSGMRAEFEREGEIMIELLTKVPLFAPLTKKDYKFLAGIAKQMEYPARTVLFREGEYGDRLYIVIEGEIEIIKALDKPEEHVLRICTAGDYIGEMCFLNPGGLRSASVVSRTAVRLLEISRTDFETLLRRRPALTYAIACGLTERLVDSEDKYIRTVVNKDHEPSGLPEGDGPASGTGTGEAGQRSEMEDEQSKFDSKPTHLLEIRTFGGFEIFRAAAPIESEGKGRFPILLLKAIISHGSVGVPKDVLIEDLWSETSPTSAQRNFKVVLHRLRKLLKPPKIKGLGSSYVILKNNLVSLRKNFCRTDLDEFLALGSRGRKAELSGDIDKAISCYVSAIDLYGGDFLTEELYTPWVESRRRELRTMYTDLLFRTAELYQAQGSSKKAAEYYRLVVKTDPVNEGAYQNLMQIFSNRGMRAEAIHIYEECKRVLESDLGVDPSELTVSIYKKILNSNP